jgi:hypothetical protein
MRTVVVIINEHLSPPSLKLEIELFPKTLGNHVVQYVVWRSVICQDTFFVSEGSSMKRKHRQVNSRRSCDGLPAGIN